MNQNLNDLIEQFKTLSKEINDMHKLLDEAQNDLNKNNLDDEYLLFLTKTLDQICILANSYLKNFDAYITNEETP